LFKNDDELNWKKIYRLPHRVALDTKSREFQYKLLNRCLATNVLLSKIGLTSSPACSFCGKADESLEHIFSTCHYTEKFRGDVIKWMDQQSIQIKSFSLKDIMLGITDEEDLFINHILLIAKKHMYWCRFIKVKPLIITFKAQVKKIYQLETSVAKSSNKWPIHAKKWGKYIEV